MITPNEFSRPQTKLKSVKGIVIHWVANPMSTAEANRNFFERRKEGNSGYGSAHYIVGLQGEIVQCIPEDEIAYHVGSKTYTEAALKRLSKYPNDCTIGIEFCHPDDSGKPNDITYQALLQLTSSLLKKYNLTSDNLWTHYGVVGWKVCPKYYVENPKEWERFKNDVTAIGDDELDTNVANDILHYLGLAWKTAKNEKEQDKIHKLANAIRKASGQPLK